MAHKHENATFTKEQEIYIIEQFSILKSPTAVKRQFLAKYREVLRFKKVKNKMIFRVKYNDSDHFFLSPYTMLCINFLDRE